MMPAETGRGWLPLYTLIYLFMHLFVYLFVFKQFPVGRHRFPAPLVPPVTSVHVFKGPLWNI